MLSALLTLLVLDVVVFRTAVVDEAPVGLPVLVPVPVPLADDPLLVVATVPVVGIGVHGFPE